MLHQLSRAKPIVSPNTIHSIPFNKFNIRAVSCSAHQLYSNTSTRYKQYGVASRYQHTISAQQSNTISSTVTTESIMQHTLDTLAVDSIHNKFRVLSHTHIPELNMILIKLQHTQSYTIWYHTLRSDNNNTFCIGLRTPVNNNTGVAHILEHTVLTGSIKYPVRDPFFSLLRRSLQTYMNAMTSSDTTMYPVASTNINDLRNLCSVYCDSVFNPLLRREAFQQEGYRLQYNTNNTPCQLQHAGIVYNEMKGVLSDNNSLYSYGLLRELFADTESAYIYNSGGNPPDITRLTYNELKSFHSQHYNIYNTVFMSYGCHVPLFDIVDDNVIQPVLHRQPRTIDTNTDTIEQHNKIKSINELQRWNEPREIHSTCPPDSIVNDVNKQHKLSLVWLCQPFDDGTDSEWESQIESFGLSLLTSLLLDGTNTPLYNVLLESQLGMNYAPGTGYDNTINQPYISIGLSNCNINDKQSIIDSIYTVLHNVVDTGFQQQYIDALLHQIELSMKHVTSNFGIGLVTKLIQSWAYQHNIEYTTRISDMIHEIKYRITNKSYIQYLINKHLLNNTHRLTYIMSPDSDYLTKQHQAELDGLQHIQSKLTDTDIQSIQHDEELLLEWQKSSDDTSCLPGLNVSDIKPTIEPIQLTTMPNHTDQPLVQYTIQPTNTMLYTRIAIDCSELSTELIQYIPLYNILVTELATKQFDYKLLAHQLELYTGGINSSLSLTSTIDGLLSYKQQLIINTSCLHYNVESMYDILYQILYEPLFNDTQRIIQLLYQSISSTIQSIQDNASLYASIDSTASIWPLQQQNEQLNGISYIKYLSQLNHQLTDDHTIDNIIDKMKQINAYIIQHGVSKVLITTDQGTLDSSQKYIDTFINRLHCATTNTNNSLITPSNWSSQLYQHNYYSLPVQVNNTTLSLPSVYYLHSDSPALDVMCKLISQLYIHSIIREKYGAYGGYMNHNSIDGIISISSYRDPMQCNTVNTFKSTGEWLLSNQSITQTNLDECKLSLFSSIDSPRAPSMNGMTQWIYDISDIQRQQYRSQLLDVSMNDIKQCADQYLVQPIKNRQYNVTIVGRQENIDLDIINNHQLWKIKKLELNVD